MAANCMVKAAYLQGAIVVLTVGRAATNPQVHPEADGAEEVQRRDVGC